MFHNVPFTLYATVFDIGPYTSKDGLYSHNYRTHRNLAPKIKFGCLVTILIIPPGATLPYKMAALPFSTSTFQENLFQALRPVNTRAVFKHISASEIVYHGIK
jgi:hypothetical protein